MCKSFTNYGPNKRRTCNWVVSHLRITDFYAKQTAPLLQHPKILVVILLGVFRSAILNIRATLYARIKEQRPCQLQPELVEVEVEIEANHTRCIKDIRFTNCVLQLACISLLAQKFITRVLMIINLCSYNTNDFVFNVQILMKNLVVA